jgi:hypothetical protein
VRSVQARDEEVSRLSDLLRTTAASLETMSSSLRILDESRARELAEARRRIAVAEVEMEHAQRRELRALHALAKYGRHDDRCGAGYGGSTCSCGLDEFRTMEEA